MTISKPAFDVQAPRQVSGVKARDKFISELLTDRKLTATQTRVAVKIALFFNCTTGQCNPGYEKIAAQLGISKRSVIRAVAVLAERGWIEVRRGDAVGPKNNFLLFLQPVGVVTSAVTPSPAIATEGQVTKTQEAGDKNAGEKVTTAVTQNTDRTLNINRGGLQPPPRVVDRVFVTEPVTAVTLSRAEAFEKLLAEYPVEKIGDTEQAFRAFELALDAGQSPESILERFFLETGFDQAEDLPRLENWLRLGPLRQIDDPHNLAHAGGDEDEPW
jgi:Helix-turn-helix domain